MLAREQNKLDNKKSSNKSRKLIKNEKKTLPKKTPSVLGQFPDGLFPDGYFPEGQFPEDISTTDSSPTDSSKDSSLKGQFPERTFPGITRITYFIS